MRIQIVAAAALAASLFAVAPSSAKTEKPPAAPAAVALAWNANAVAAVRAASVIDPQGTAARPLYQTEGLLYMSYVQAAVYDAATQDRSPLRALPSLLRRGRQRLTPGGGDRSRLQHARVLPRRSGRHPGRQVRSVDRRASRRPDDSQGNRGRPGGCGGHRGAAGERRTQRARRNAVRRWPAPARPVGLGAAALPADRANAVDGGDAAVHARQHLAVPGARPARADERAVYERLQRNEGVRLRDERRAHCLRRRRSRTSGTPMRSIS